MSSEQYPDATGVVTDSVTLATIRDFLRAEKPSELTPVDILLVLHMMTRKAEDHYTTDSLQTLAGQFNCCVKTVSRAQKRLASPRFDYISRLHRKGFTNAATINVSAIPAEAAVRELISEDAKTLAGAYHLGLIKRGRKKFNRQFTVKQQLSAQRILNKCGGDSKLAARMVTHAVDSPAHQAKARKSLYELLGRWKLIERTFAAQQQLKEAA